MIFRSTEWEGPAPARGDVVRHGETLYVVTDLAQGPGPGQYRLWVELANVIEWEARTCQPAR